MIKKQKTKTLTVKDNGRSSDAISPNYIYGCLGGCMKSYCYVGRYNQDNVYINANSDQIEDAVSTWAWTKSWPKEPNQVDDKYYVIDIGCNTDLPLMQKYVDLQDILNFYIRHPKLKATFATKYPSKLNIPGQGQRVRISLMPETIRMDLERDTDSIPVRLAQYKRLVDLGWEVHLNFSPVVVYNAWEQDYAELFGDIKREKINTKCEVIFLTHSDRKHERNLKDGFPWEYMLWKPTMQEHKVTSYGSDAVRYRHELKREFVNIFKEIYSRYWDISNIRYIF